MINMIEERYVNFETARLLHKKGFLADNEWYYNEDTQELEQPKKGDSLNKFIENHIDAPTQAMTLAWLREVHNLHIIICIDDLDWNYQIVNFKNKLDVEYIKDLAGFNSYENAADAAILECITNLI